MADTGIVGGPNRAGSQVDFNWFSVTFIANNMKDAAARAFTDIYDACQFCVRNVNLSGRMATESTNMDNNTQDCCSQQQRK